MGIFARLKAKVTEKFLGELIKDFGTLSTDGYGRNLSLAIYQKPGQKPCLLVKWTAPGNTDYRAIDCSLQWAQQFENIAAEMRRLSSPPATPISTHQT